MVSACAYSGGYPTGYGTYDLNTEGRPGPLLDRLQATGFTHFQQSGTGAIRKYYNYARVVPMTEPLDALGTAWSLDDEEASPGRYAATLGAPDGDGSAANIRAQLTAGPKSVVHRYNFPEHPDARVVLDLSAGGIGTTHGQTVPIRAVAELLAPGVARAKVFVEGVPLYMHLRITPPASAAWRQSLWYDRRLMGGGTRLEFDSIRATTLRPFGFIFRGPIDQREAVELAIGFSLRSFDQARDNLDHDVPEGTGFAERRAATEAAWQEHLDHTQVEGGTPAQRTVFATAAYRAAIKPCFAENESPFWPGDGPFVFDICTMWDIYKTQIPLLAAFAPDRFVQLLNALTRIAEEEGNFPIGYRMARGADRFFRQASALAHTAAADACGLGVTGVDWEWVLTHLESDLRRTFGEDYLAKGVAHPLSHTLDLAGGYQCAARVAEHVGDTDLAEQLHARSGGWRNAFDPATGLLGESTYYEGGKWNYSFRLLHDMKSRIELAGGDQGFVGLLDQFFGFPAPDGTPAPTAPVLTAPPINQEHHAAGYKLNRFQGLNNEPDMEAPWAYHYAGRPDRTAEVVHAALAHAFGTGRGGLPGNDDSGGLSSWVVWASLGLFPVAGQNLFLLSPPSFPVARLQMPRGELVVEARGLPDAPLAVDATPRFIRAASFDGRPLKNSWLPGRAVHGGGTAGDRARRTAPAQLGHRPRRPPPVGRVAGPGLSSAARAASPTKPTSTVARRRTCRNGLLCHGRVRPCGYSPTRPKLQNPRPHAAMPHGGLTSVPFLFLLHPRRSPHSHIRLFPTAWRLQHLPCLAVRLAPLHERPILIDFARTLSSTTPQPPQHCLICAHHAARLRKSASLSSSGPIPSSAATPAKPATWPKSPSAAATARSRSSPGPSKP